jgi:hypothetical protein
MNLAKALTELPVHDLGPECTVTKTLRNLPVEDAEALRAALADERWRMSDLSKVLADEGIHIAGGTLARHRRGACKCARLGEP